MKLFQKNCQRETSEYNIHEEIEKVKAQMDAAYSNFQNAVDPDLIDCCIFESNAAWKKYRFLLRQAKGQTFLTLKYGGLKKSPFHTLLQNNLYLTSCAMILVIPYSCRIHHAF